ncbi:MAG: hypothetical protein Ct9H300mP12_04860 [Acidimicrobiales bacterium]|nr:MAG: hypothetical protein Ct9H300mP12_04860 [Acidimicrobiales bacterium]
MPGWPPTSRPNPVRSAERPPERGAPVDFQLVTDQAEFEALLDVLIMKNGSP